MGEKSADSQSESQASSPGGSGVSDTDRLVIEGLWTSGLWDTWDLARILKLREAQIYNVIARRPVKHGND